MNNLTTEQLLAAHKANVDTLFGLTQKVFEGLEKLVDLNLQVAKAAMVEATEGARSAMSVTDAKDLMTLQQQWLQPTAEKMTDYSSRVCEIAAATNGEVTKVAETRWADMQRAMTTLVDGAARNAPVGNDSAVALVKSALTAANDAFESVQKATKQASELAQSSLQAMGSAASPMTQAPPTRAKRT